MRFRFADGLSPQDSWRWLLFIPAVAVLAVLVNYRFTFMEVGALVILSLCSQRLHIHGAECVRYPVDSVRSATYGSVPWRCEEHRLL